MAILKQIKLNPAFDKLPLKNMFIYSIVFSVITLLVSVLIQTILPPEIPLFYGLPQTAEQLATSYLITLPSLVSITITIVNSILAVKINDSYLKKALAFGSFATSILALITTFKIMFLIGSI